MSGVDFSTLVYLHKNKTRASCELDIKETINGSLPSLPSSKGRDLIQRINKNRIINTHSSITSTVGS